ADLNARLHIVERIVEHLDRVLLEALLDILESGVDDALGNRLLAVEHDAIHELRQDQVPELGIGEDDALFRATTTGHRKFLSERRASLTRAAQPAINLIWAAWRRTWS